MGRTEVIYGVHPILEMLKAGRRRCHKVFVASGRRAADQERISDEAARRQVPLEVVERSDIDRLANTEKHQGVAARVDPFAYASIEEIVGRAAKDDSNGFIVILDGVEDPHNVGSLVRTASLMGVHGIVIPRDKAAGITPTVVKVSAGAAEHLPIASVTNINSAISQLKEKGYWISAAAGEASEPLYQHDFKGYNVAIVLGAEGRGVRRLVRERSDYLLSIPMQGNIESYNVSVAGALFMGEVARQRWLETHAKDIPS
jgi:23S rRNA (guanosine2251-2'-O)-methyltransferase